MLESGLLVWKQDRPQAPIAARNPPYVTGRSGRWQRGLVLGRVGPPRARPLAPLVSRAAEGKTLLLSARFRAHCTRLKVPHQGHDITAVPQTVHPRETVKPERTPFLTEHSGDPALPGERGDVGCGVFECFENNSCQIQGLQEICLTFLHNAGKFDSQGKSFIKDALKCMAHGLRHKFSCISRKCLAVKDMVFQLQRECYVKHNLCAAAEENVNVMVEMIHFQDLFPKGPYVELVNTLLGCGEGLKEALGRSVRLQCEQNWGALCETLSFCSPLPPARARPSPRRPAAPPPRNPAARAPGGQGQAREEPPPQGTQRGPPPRRSRRGGPRNQRHPEVKGWSPPHPDRTPHPPGRLPLYPPAD
ncbi:hypothetical protein COCON_G00040270 [Conger conger]|uniref:Stanniocalcin n=1 Tax=Conger conger TaxID=82655 RepID=A0A9Q1DTF1_CONCO|nr:hypothetical protein COCON_G00040270 [Conger conger]